MHLTSKPFKLVCPPYREEDNMRVQVRILDDLVEMFCIFGGGLTDTYARLNVREIFQQTADSDICFIFKTYSENEGLLEATSHLFVPTGAFVKVGWVQCPVVKINLSEFNVEY